MANGVGCGPGQAVNVQIAGQAAGSTTADSRGRFSSPLRLPDLAPGRYDVTADCGTVLATTVDLVVSSQVDPVTSTLAVLLFFLLSAVALLTRGRTRRARPRHQGAGHD